MRLHRFLSLSSLVLAGLAASTVSAHAASKAALMERMAAASAKSSLADPALKPWHLKFTVQLFDAAGKPSQTATIEQWSAGSDEKRIYTSPLFSATEIKHGKDLFRTAGKPSPPYLLDLARLEVVDPMPSAAQVSLTQPDLRNELFGKVSLACIMLDEPLKTIPLPPLGLFPTYCIDPQTGVLRFSYRSGALSITRNRLGNFQDRSVAIDTTINRGDPLVEKIHIDTLGEWIPDSALFATDSSFVKVATEIVHVDTAVMQANILTDPAPIYSELAMRKLAYGTVVLRATIGADGYVRETHLVSAPDPELAKMALAAVPLWTYKPYLVNGQPVEVETLIPVKCQY